MAEARISGDQLAELANDARQWPLVTNIALDLREARERVALLETALAPFVSIFDGECRLDHDGDCQQHCISSPCPIPAARDLLAADLEDGD